MVGLRIIILMYARAVVQGQVTGDRRHSRAGCCNPDPPGAGGLGVVPVVASDGVASPCTAVLWSKHGFQIAAGSHDKTTLCFILRPSPTAVGLRDPDHYAASKRTRPPSAFDDYACTVADLDSVEAAIWALLDPYRDELEEATIYGMPSLRWPGSGSHDYFAAVKRSAHKVSLYAIAVDTWPKTFPGLLQEVQVAAHGQGDLFISLHGR